MSKKNSSPTVCAFTSILKLLIVIKTTRAHFSDYELKMSGETSPKIGRDILFSVLGTINKILNNLKQG